MSLAGPNGNLKKNKRARAASWEVMRHEPKPVKQIQFSISNNLIPWTACWHICTRYIIEHLTAEKTHRP